MLRGTPCPLRQFSGQGVKSWASPQTRISPKRSSSLLVVSNPAGIRLKKDARVLQVVFFELDAPAEKTYAGRYQNENK